jgi:hypothetical protein
MRFGRAGCCTLVSVQSFGKFLPLSPVNADFFLRETNNDTNYRTRTQCDAVRRVSRTHGEVTVGKPWRATATRTVRRRQRWSRSKLSVKYVACRGVARRSSPRSRACARASKPSTGSPGAAKARSTFLTASFVNLSRAHRTDALRASRAGSFEFGRSDASELRLRSGRYPSQPGSSSSVC